MTYCKKTILCRQCPKFNECTPAIRYKKRKRNSFANCASSKIIHSASTILAKGWYSSERLGQELYNKKPTDRTGRMNIMMRARRAINRLKELGCIATRKNERGYLEYTLITE